MGHLKEKRFSNFISKLDSDGFVGMSLILLALFFTAASVMLYVNSFGQAVALFFLEVVFEAGAVPAGISVIIKEYNPQKSRGVYLAKIAALEILVLLIIAALLKIAKHFNWSFHITCIILGLLTVVAVAWEAANS